MNEDRLQATEQAAIRKGLRIGGLAAFGLGLLFTIIGLASFFSSMGSFGEPRFFWCLFVGMPLLFAGAVMCQWGFLGIISRYMAGETAPVAKDVVNYLGENTQPGVKAVAKSITEGILEAQREQR
jgi:hypothetical protein